MIRASEGEVQIQLSSVPASVQAKKARRDQIVVELRAITSTIPILFSGDVGVTIELWRSEQDQYESDRSADIDNVIKPILDALSGPEGVVIDDNQVQSVQCYWVHNLETSTAVVTIENRLHDLIEKDGLVFVHLGKQLYFPVNGTLPKEFNFKLLDMLENYKEARMKGEEIGVGYHDLRYFMPSQRYFHKTRLSKFRCIEFDEARQEFA